MIDLLGGNIKASGILRYPYSFPKQALMNLIWLYCCDIKGWITQNKDILGGAKYITSNQDPNSHNSDTLIQ